ncbi:MAG: TIGR02270 family protein [Geobacteraceae bacterium]|nr:TIGR02270 family protein [Geobacteraceae bacterium]
MQGIITEFAEEAAFLWHLRTGAVGAPHFTLDDLAQLDGRIEANIDGLRVSGDAGWDICEATLGSEDPEKYFAPSVLALESGLAHRIRAVLDAVGKDTTKARALISALGWIHYEQAEPHITNLLNSESPIHRYIGIAASAVHRRDPGKHLDKTVHDACTLLLARGLRAYGELGRKIKLNYSALRDNLSDEDDGIRFSTAWSEALAGSMSAVEVLKSFVAPGSPYKEKALNLALRRMDLTSALCFQTNLAQSSDTIRFALIGAGIIGDPISVPWLIEQMKNPALARVGGEAFTMITGVDLELEELRGKRPEGFNAGPSDDPNDDDVAMDADEYLPWPAGVLIAAWWKRNKGAFQSGTRYLLGKPISADHLRHVLKRGLQRQRSAAALELAIIQPGRPLFEVRAPGFRQQEVLRQKTEG